MRSSSAKPESIENAPLPSNLEAERSVLGAILMDNKCFDEAAVLKDKDFSLFQNRLIYGAMGKLYEAGEAIDLVTLTERMYASGELEDAGGPSYLASLADGMPRISNVAHYAKIVRKKSMHRQILYIADLSQRLSFAAEEEPEEVADSALQKFMDLVMEYASERLQGKTSAESRISLLQSLEKKENLLRVNTGVTELDKATGGFRAGELVTITASVTGSGKTLFAQQIKSLNCKNGIHGLYFSGEMMAEQLAAREIATDAGVPHWKLRRPEHISKEEYTALCSQADDCRKCRIVDGEFSIRDIRVASRRMKASGDLSWVVVDYDELVDAPGKDDLAQQRVVIREAKRLAMTLEIPVLMISGIRKPLEKGEAKRPKLEQVYGSGAKSKHSTYVLFIDREYVRELRGEESNANIYILKSRNGKIGKIEARFNLATLRFEDKKGE